MPSESRRSTVTWSDLARTLAQKLWEKSSVSARNLETLDEAF